MLFIDGSLNHRRIASELRRRGRAAESAAQRGLDRSVFDDDLLRGVAELYEDAVIVTADDHMPDEWAAVIAELGSTIANVAPCVGPVAALYTSEDQWERDTVQRWAHVMQLQARNTVRRYSPTSNRRWRRR